MQANDKILIVTDHTTSESIEVEVHEGASSFVSRLTWVAYGNTIATPDVVELGLFEHPLAADTPVLMSYQELVMWYLNLSTEDKIHMLSKVTRRASMCGEN